MREIKFRQWLSYNKTWHYFEFKNGMCSGVVNASLDSYPIMQYTGLKDKNGKEIYEGDVCRIKYIESKPDVVEFRNGCFKFRYRDHYIFNYDEVEIIGNIHENPELLK